MSTSCSSPKKRCLQLNMQVQISRHLANRLPNSITNRFRVPCVVLQSSPWLPSTLGLVPQILSNLIMVVSVAHHISGSTKRNMGGPSSLTKGTRKCVASEEHGKEGERPTKTKRKSKATGQLPKRAHRQDGADTFSLCVRQPSIPCSCSRELRGRHGRITCHNDCHG